MSNFFNYVKFFKKWANVPRSPLHGKTMSINTVLHSFIQTNKFTVVCVTYYHLSLWHRIAKLNYELEKGVRALLSVDKQEYW